LSTMQQILARIQFRYIAEVVDEKRQSTAYLTLEYRHLLFDRAWSVGKKAQDMKGANQGKTRRYNISESGKGMQMLFLDDILNGYIDAPKHRIEYADGIVIPAKDSEELRLAKAEHEQAKVVVG